MLRNLYKVSSQAKFSARSQSSGACCRLLKDVNTACLEANDTVKYLKPLRKYLEKMNSMDDFTALIELFKPMFHTMMLIWKHSGYYNTSAKMVTLIREMCNDLIMQACKFVPGWCASLALCVSLWLNQDSKLQHAINDLNCALSDVLASCVNCFL